MARCGSRSPSLGGSKIIISVVFIQFRGLQTHTSVSYTHLIIQQKALLGMVNLLPNDAESLEAVPYFGDVYKRQV